MHSQPFRYKQNRFQQLRGFCAVVEMRSVSKAAIRLHLAQPSVSLQVQALELEVVVDAEVVEPKIDTVLRTLGF